MDQLRLFLNQVLDILVEEEVIEEKPALYILPPESKQMVYPCFTISRETGDTAFASNEVYRHQKQYQLTAIDEDPEGPWYDILAALPRSTHNRSFPADNLNHDVFTLFF